MITPHFHLQLQYKYELFHIYFTSPPTARENMNSINWPPSNVWLHCSVGRASHRYRGGHGFESCWSPDFFRFLLSNCLNWKIYCDDHSSLSSTTAAQIWLNYFIYIYFTFLRRRLHDIRLSVNSSVERAKWIVSQSRVKTARTRIKYAYKEKETSVLIWEKQKHKITANPLRPNGPWRLLWRRPLCCHEIRLH